MAVELDTMPATLEAELNYYVDTGETPVSLVAGPGGSIRGSAAGRTRRIASP